MTIVPQNLRLLAWGIGVLIVSALASAGARAQTFNSSFTASDGKLEQASAAFSLTNGTLTLVLTNTSTFTSYGNPDVLSGVFFAIAGNPNLTPVSATASTSPTCAACVSGDVGANYAYVPSASGFTTKSGSVFTLATYGVGAPGFGNLVPSFGAKALSFSPPTTHAHGQGLADSIVGPDYQSGGNGPFVDSSVTFVWSVPGVTSVSISNVLFAYGTNPDGSNPASVPEPATLGLFAVGALGAGLLRQCRRATRRAP